MVCNTCSMVLLVCVLSGVLLEPALVSHPPNWFPKWLTQRMGQAPIVTLELIDVDVTALQKRNHINLCSCIDN